MVPFNSGLVAVGFGLRDLGGFAARFSPHLHLRMSSARTLGVAPALLAPFTSGACDDLVPILEGLQRARPTGFALGSSCTPHQFFRGPVLCRVRRPVLTQPVLYLGLDVRNFQQLAVIFCCHGGVIVVTSYACCGSGVRSLV